ncbi:hypothetical protein, partial [Sulfuricurvum sp.]|uniref:hypothetical protein n=1 Tax=Sulfuricurvum sp. TaxID=2025608 RepID=UPI003BB51798
DVVADEERFEKNLPRFNPLLTSKSLLFPNYNTPLFWGAGGSPSMSGSEPLLSADHPIHKSFFVGSISQKRNGKIPPRTQ